MFVSSGTQSNRFSLLLLDEGEYYFEDFGAYYYPAADTDENSVKKKQKGRIKLCSKSILFEPEDLRFPISKFPFDYVVGCGKSGSELSRIIQTNEIFLIRSELRIDCREGGQNHPYKFVKEKRVYSFSLIFETLINFLPKAQNLLRISQLSINENEKQLGELIENHEASILFNHTWLINISEKTQIELTGVRVTPLVNNPGRIVVTESRLYFQPLNNVGSRPVDRFELGHIVRVLKRRHCLRQVGLEIFFRNSESFYLSFKNQAIRNRVYDTIISQQSVPKMPHNDLENMTQKWRNRAISNFEYLMFLNNQAHRSFNDLTQYPVFPWIIADYQSPELDLNNPKTFRDLSKPIGALNSDRLAGLKERFNMMKGIPDQQPFLYGTHYSTPGYVLYYLVRKAPEYMLRLQNGRFDSPNRMFHSIKETWEGVLINPSDVKELIPEFYIEPGDFLVNSEALKLGIRQSGEMLNDVNLPIWAKNSPSEFIRISKEALESEYVSQNLHKWIDLIFGYAQTGQAAIDHDNVFYPLTYEGAVDIEKVSDPRERKSIEAQINEFGQTPHQLFKSPHPPRHPPGITENINDSSSKVNAPSSPSRQSPTIATTSDVQQNNNNNNVGGGSGGVSSSSSSTNASQQPAIDLKRKMMDDQFNLLFGHSVSSPIITSPVNSIINSNFDALDDEFNHHHHSNNNSKRNWKNLSSLSLSQQYKLHKSQVNGVAIKGKEKVYSVSSDSCLKLYDLDSKRLTRSVPISNLALSSIEVLELNNNEDNVIMGSWDNHIYIYSSEEGRVNESFYAHDDVVSCIKLRGDTLLTGSWDCIVKMWKLGASRGITSSTTSTHIFDLAEHYSQIRCVDLSFDSNLGIAGAAEGYVKIFDQRDPSGLSRSFCVNNGSDINGITFSYDNKKIITGSQDGFVRVFDLFSKQEILSFSMGSPVRSVSTDGDRVVCGLENGNIGIADLHKIEILPPLFDRNVNRGSLLCHSISDDGQLLIAGHFDASIAVWSTP